MSGTDDAFRPDEDIDDTLWPTADRVHRVLGSGQMRPEFRARLRRDLVAAREAAISGSWPPAAGAPGGPRRPGGAPPGTRRRPPGRPGPLRRRHRVLGWTGAVAAVVVAGLVLVFHGTVVSHQAAVRVSVLSNVDGAASATASALRLTFSQPLDHDATASAIRLAPATQVRSAWEGNTLMVTPVYGFAPNSAYVLTVDHAVARTTAGAPLSADLHVLFGTAPATGQGANGNQHLAAPQQLTLKPVGGNGSQALVTPDGTVRRIATDALCTSRSGRSVAFVERGAAGTRVVFANAAGTPTSKVPVNVDKGSPLGWINDAEVVFVGGGRLQAVDRGGKVRTLSGTAVDAAHDTVTVSSGGRYVYLRSASGGSGRITDLQSSATRTLPGATGEAAFSGDGATVAWFDRSGADPVLDVAASGGGPVLRVPLAVGNNDRLSDLALAPDGYRFVYTVTTPNHAAQLRLATLPDGRTVAAADGTAGVAPNWAPSGRFFTVSTGGQVQAVPVDPGDRQPSLQALATAFANAEISGDAGAQRALATPDAALPGLPVGVTRAAVLWVLPASGGTANARLRLTIDPTPDQPVARQADETLVLGPRGDGTFAVRAASLKDFQAAPAAPQVIRCDPDSLPGAVLLTFDSDLDPDTVATAIGLSSADGTAVPATASYDAVNRTVTVQPRAATTAPVVVRVGTGLRDIRGQRPPADLRVTVNLGR